MKKTVTILILSIAIGGLDFCGVEAKEKDLTYHSFADENSTEVIAETKVKIKELNNGQTEIVRLKQFDDCLVTDNIIYDQSGDLVSWHRTCPGIGTDFTVVKDNGIAQIKGHLRGEHVTKNIDLDSKSLHIYPKYSLVKFAFSDDKKMKFWTLRRDELNKLPMQAIHKGAGTISINGKEVEAVKVYFSIVGKLRERFHNHNYYYRKSDGLFIKKIEEDGRIQLLVNEK